MKGIKTNIVAFVALAVVLLFGSCIKEERYLTDSSVRLEFSDDTVMFDTVFTTMATITRQVKVYNRYDEPLLINTVALQGGGASRFRLNVDGDTSRIARDVEIGAGDSIFIFIQANINPNDATSPFLIEDAVVFGFNNRQQSLPVTAYGRNAVYHHPTNPHSIYYLQMNRRGQYDTVWIPYSVIDCANWDHSRPHVIFGYAVVNSNETLHLTAGDELYFATGACLWVYDSATLDVRGSMDAPVVFTSIRHDGYYDSLPGQWESVWLSTGSKNNYIEWARIENATIGIQVDTNVNNSPTLQIANSIIRNHSRMGILGQGAWIEGDNLLVSCCGEYLACLMYGGRYLFSNSTFANYWRYSSRKTPSIRLNNYYMYSESTVFPRPLQQAEFRNCIIYGNYNGSDNSGELQMDWMEGCEMNCAFRNCLMRTALVDSNACATYSPSPIVAGGNLIVNRDPLFVDAGGNNYELQDESPAKGAGSSSWLKTGVDLKGTPRGNPPTIGAYE